MYLLICYMFLTQINGVLYLIVNDAEALENTQIQIESKEKRNFQMQVHPNIDKKLFLQNSIIAIKPEGKPYLLGEKVTPLYTINSVLLYVPIDWGVEMEVR